MKNSVKILALLCALVMLVSLAACGDEKKEDAEKKSGGDTAETTVEANDSELADFEWVRFEMPENFADTKESDSYVTVADSSDDKHKFKLFQKKLLSDQTIDTYMEDENKYSQSASFDDPINVGGREWKVVHFDFNAPSVKLYTQVDDTHCCQIVVYDHLEDDPSLLTILNNIEFVLDKFWN